MSTALAIALVGLIHAAVIAAAIFAVRAGKWADALIVLFPLATVGLLLWQFGYFAGRSVPEISMASLEVQDPAGAACVKLREELDKVGLIIDDSQPGRVVVNAELWNQVPLQFRDGIVRCLNQLAPGNGEGEVEIIPSNTG